MFTDKSDVKIKTPVRIYTKYCWIVVNADAQLLILIVLSLKNNIFNNFGINNYFWIKCDKT